MYNEHFGFAEAPFSVTPDSRFFFVNPCYEEAFATLRYGIDARKGFVVITGQPGTGKTTLLKRLTSSLDSNVQAACVFDPHLSFIELLRLAFNEFGLTPAGDDRLTMMAQLYDHLVQQLERGQIVCLMIDEAQNLSIETLEELRLLSNLETDTEKLIQIILVGQPEFEEKLDRPELVQLKQRVALRCRLKPLQPHEIGLYLKSRLETVHYSRADLFDNASIEHIARYSNGIPRLINSVCDNALLIAYVHNRRYISAEDIDEAAHELQLTTEESQTPIRDFAPPPNFAKPENKPAFQTQVDRKPAFQTQVDRERATNATAASAPRPTPEFEPYAGEFWEPAHLDEPPSSRGRGIGLAVILFMSAGTLLFYSTQQKPLSWADVHGWASRIVNSGQPNQPRPPSAALAPEKPLPAENAAAPAPEPDNLPSTNPQPLKDDAVSAAGNAPTSAIDGQPPNEAVQAPRAQSQPSEMRDNKRAIVKNRPLARTQDDDALGGKDLEIEIYKAIRDRAITGVQVSSINDGTVYLVGRVATPRQKLAAVRAALSVPGVKSVRDQIAIDY